MNRKIVPAVTLVLGGARSGKSRFAEGLVEDSGLEPVYVATGRAFDNEMAVRISAHKERRGEKWRTLEVPLDLAGALRREVAEQRAILIDCATLWITNLMMENRDMQAESDRLVTELKRVRAPVVIVSNEVGMGIVPENEMARAFRDHAGELHQQIAEIAQTVYLVVAGQPLAIK